MKLDDNTKDVFLAAIGMVGTAIGALVGYMIGRRNGTSTTKNQSGQNGKQ